MDFSNHPELLLPPMYRDAALIYGGFSSHVWDIGSGMALKIRQDRQRTDVTRTQEFIELNTTIPIPKIHQELVDRDRGVHLLYMDNIQGESLDQVWETLSKPVRESIADQMVVIIRQLSSLTSNYIGGLGEMPLWDDFLFPEQADARGPFYRNEDFFVALASQIDGAYHAALPALYKLMPSAEPPTFTHGCLDMGSVIVREGRIVGITGWENAGFFPVWWEYTCMQFSPGIAEEWKEMLRDRGLQRHPDGTYFMSLVEVLRGGGVLAAQMCEALVSESYDAIQQVLWQVAASEYED